MNPGRIEDYVDAVREEVQEIVRRRVEPNDPLLSSRLLDSMSAVELSLSLEARFGIKISATEIKPEHFETCSSIAAFVRTKVR